MSESVNGDQLSLLDHGGMHWLHVSGFELRIRESRRAKRLILHLVPPGLLEVVVPRGVKAGAVETFVRDNHAWIAAARRELDITTDKPLQRLPDRITLLAVGREYDVHYRVDECSRVREHSPKRLVVQYPGADASAAALLRSWLLARGREILRPWLKREAMRIGVEPSGIQVRLQRTRWGSCSSQRCISLNAALLLVEPELVRYLLVHELCHLTHMNHSDRYWARVGRFEPDYRAADRRLNRAWRALPMWLFDSGGGRA